MGISKNANKHTKANAVGSVATCASSGLNSKPSAKPLPTKIPNRADATDRVKAIAGEKNPRCIKIPKYIMRETSMREEIQRAPKKLTR